VIQQAFAKLIEHQDLTRPEMTATMGEIADGGATPAQVGAFLAALRLKGETVDEIAGAAEVMRARVDRVHVAKDVFVDTCGTGGDGRNTFNISTGAAFVVAGAGVTVAKHGNRAVSSRSGSADVLAALGVDVDAPKEVVERCIADVGIGLVAAAGMAAIAAKGRALTGFALELCHQLDLESPTPTDPERRGAHVAVHVRDADHVHKELTGRGVITDVRRPDVIRLGCAALTTRFVDVFDGVMALADVEHRDRRR